MSNFVGTEPTINAQNIDSGEDWCEFTAAEQVNGLDLVQLGGGRLAINTWLAENKVALGIAKLVNLSSASAIDGQTCPSSLLDPANTTYFSDGTHYTLDVGVPLYVTQFVSQLATLGL